MSLSAFFPLADFEGEERFLYTANFREQTMLPDSRIDTNTEGKLSPGCRVARLQSVGGALQLRGSGFVDTLGSYSYVSRPFF